MMKYFFYSLCVGIILFMSSCDGEEFGFNVSSEIDLDVPGNYTLNEIRNAPMFNPPAEEEEVKLAEVEAFSDAINDINNIGQLSLNSMSYAIQDVDPNEITDLDEITISVRLGGRTIELIRLVGELNNVSKTPIILDNSEIRAIENEFLTNSDNEVTTIVNFDFSEVPNQSIEVNVQVFFDLTLRVRN